MNTSAVRILLQRTLVQNVTKVNRYSVLAKQLPAVSNVAGTGLRYCSAGKNRYDKNCVDKSLHATYDEIANLHNHPEKLLIDVRDAAEIAATGSIPTITCITDQLKLSSDAFKALYGCKKPTTNDALIFTCCVGTRSGIAAFLADKLGYKNVKNYVGSWQEYAQKNNLTPGPAKI
ncbi:rhodanese domain-containing protein CG4456-like [Wyeomyia smithii]|uniref:rhodanese domain-containing protein CG4456-like n=1 Tax=Wyeomyia smithii TaxID=174621 RepID=UPI002467C2C0|nr:rhodanese domain-containing protein CG4456-like [Wyeomyia smithii]